jgi:hypothetical protein
MELSGLQGIGDNPGFDEVAVRTFKGSFFRMIRPGSNTGQVHPAAAPAATRALDRHQQNVGQ